MASKFRFESLLNIRKAEMHEQESIFRSVQKDVENARIRLMNCQHDFNQSLESLRFLYESQSIIPDKLRQHRLFHETLSLRLQKAQLDYIEQTHRQEEQRVIFEEKIKEVKTLETLKEKAEQRQDEEEKRKSSLELDELAIQQKTIDAQKRKKGTDSYEQDH